MKKLLFIFIVCLLTATGCSVGRGTISSSQGLESESFLEFVGAPKKYQDGVMVNLDDKTVFKAKVHDSGKNRRTSERDRFKGEVYAIPTGVHVVTVTHDENVIYQKQFFVSAQENYKIELP